MVQNRTLPFGYKIENGVIIVNHAEAQVVRTVFCEYGKGASYETIATRLTLGNIPYMPSKPVWNKNMVARLLQNSKYLGTDKFSAVITEQEWQAVRQAQKPFTHTESTELKEIKPYLECGCCGSKLKRRLKRNGEARWFCEDNLEHITIQVTDAVLLQNVKKCVDDLISHPEKISVSSEKCNSASLAQIRMNNEIDAMLEQEDIKDTEVKEKIFTLAIERYALCDESEVITSHLRSILEQASVGTWWATGLLKQLAKKIKVEATGEIIMVLNNGQRIGKEV